VLCGQPGLLGTIKDETLQALNERITRRIELQPLGPEDVAGYIQHRLGVAGAGEAVKFDPDATRAIGELARGLPRRINVLCDRALQEGRIEGVSVITTDLVKRAARAVAGVHDPLPAPSSPVPLPVPVRASSAAAAPKVEPPAQATVEAAPSEDFTPFADLPGLSFGQKAEDASRGRLTKIVASVAGLVLVGLGGYAAWAWSAGTLEAAVPSAPNVQVLSVGAPAVAVPVPDPVMMEELLRIPVRRPFPPVAPDALAPADAAPGGVPDPQAPPQASAENPNNGN
jgi:general secretion pathway protein A